MNLKREIFGCSVAEAAELDYWQTTAGISQIYIPIQKGRHESIAGVPLDRIQNKDVAQLLRLFISSITPISKGDIAEKVLNLQYDPTIHDKRIYKLIYLTKAILQRDDIFINLYGTYQLNPKYLGKANLVKVSAD